MCSLHGRIGFVEPHRPGHSHDEHGSKSSDVRPLANPKERLLPPLETDVDNRFSVQQHIFSVDQHGVVAIKRWPGLLGGDTSATSSKQFPPDLGGDLLVAVVQKQVQQSLTLVFGDWN